MVEVDMRYEYRVERLPIAERDKLISRLLDRLNEQSSKGWRLATMDLGVWPPRPWSEVTLLLERERRGP
jgi:hypothetical protein